MLMYSQIRNTMVTISLWVIALSATGCGSEESTDATGPAEKPATENVESAPKTDTPSIRIEDVVSIEFAEDEYIFTLDEVAQGVRFDFTILVSQDISGVVPSHNGWREWVGPSGLFPYGQIFGQGQSYSISEVGLGPGPDRTPRTFKKGAYPHFFSWDGRNWNGPSDTANPKGPPFPPGSYSFQITLVGKIKMADEWKLYEMTEIAKVTLKP